MPDNNQVTTLTFSFSPKEVSLLTALVLEASRVFNENEEAGQVLSQNEYNALDDLRELSQKLPTFASEADSLSYTFVELTVRLILLLETVWRTISSLPSAPFSFYLSNYGEHTPLEHEILRARIMERYHRLAD